MSLLRSEGHTAADLYPIGHMWVEATIAQERVNHTLASTALAHFRATAAAIETQLGGNDALKRFNSTLRELSHGDQ